MPVSKSLSNTSRQVRVRHSQASDEQFRSLADNMPNLAWIADPDGWIYWYNARWYEYTGTTSKDMEGWGWQSVHDPKQLPRVLREWKDGIASAEPVELSFPLRRADGKFRQFLTRVIPIKDNKGTILHWFGTNTDIEETEQIKQKLTRATVAAEEDRRSLRDLIMQTPAMIAVCRGPNLMYELANPMYLQVVGKTEEIIGKTVLEVFPELKGQELLSILYNVYRTGEAFTGHEVPVKLDTQNNNKPKTVYFTFVYQPLKDNDGNVNGIMTHAVNVTEQVDARRRTEESEANFRFMAESLPQKIFTADAAGKVTYFNSRWELYTGVPLDIIRRNGARQFVHPDDLEENMNMWRTALQTKEGIENEQRLRRSDGKYRRHVSHVVPMKDQSGKVIRWFGAMTDIEDITQSTARNSELEKITEALRLQREQLLALSQTKDEFISLASHQLRTPATGVKQYVGMVIEGYAGPISKEQQQFLRSAYASNERQLKIVDDLLRVARVDSGKLKLHKSHVHLIPMLETIIAEQATQFSAKNQTIIFKPKKGAHVVYVDDDLLRTVLENLIDNARKYTPEGKSITVALRALRNSVKIDIIDEGVGIEASDMEKLCQKFTRLNNPEVNHVGGTGLGLYWVKKVIDLHKAKLDISSEIGKGSTFSITLPK